MLEENCQERMNDDISLQRGAELGTISLGLCAVRQ